MSAGISKWAWIFIGTLLWGFPTSVLSAMFLSVLKPGSWSEINPFDGSIFLHKLMWTAPFFAAAGLLYGICMFYLSEKSGS